MGIAMPIDSYSLCPGGTGKPIKFCCKDQVPQLQQLERMVEGGQNKAALALIDRQLETHPDRACLLALKAMVLRALDQWEPQKVVADRFLEKYPQNPLAFSEKAMALVAEGQVREALVMLHRAIGASEGGILGRVYEAMDEVAHALLNVGEIAAGRALLVMQTAVNEQDSHPLEMVLRLNAAPSIPPLLKDEQFSSEIPEGAPAKPAFDAAMQAISQGRWLAGAEQLTALAQQYPEEPSVWRNLAILRMWLADSPGAAEALRKLAALPIPAEDAAEALAQALFMSADPLGDEVDQSQVTFTIADPEQAQTALAGWTRAVAMPVDPAELRGSEDQPPPKSVWMLLDRAPTAVDAASAEAQHLPHILCQALLFGRQTDRDARLELMGIVEPQRAALEADLRTALSNAIAGEPSAKVLGRISASRLMIRLGRYLPRGTTAEQSETLIRQLLEQALLEDWPAHRLGLLDGKSPREAAGQAAYQVRVSAAILMLQQWMDAAGESFDFNRQRTALGLPTLDPIDPAYAHVETLPLVRLARVEVEKLSDESLLVAYRRVVGFGVMAAVAKYARALVDRPQAGTPDEREAAYRLLIQRERDSGRVLELLERGRKEAQAGGRSCASFDLMELPVRLMRGEGAELGRLVDHIQRTHIREPGVGQALAQFLVEIGAIRPDGTAAMPPAAQQQDGIIVPGGGPAAESGKIWTPDGETGGGAKPGKLWTPG
jgi:tetratricopeptide (TPR) repeat protein